MEEMIKNLELGRSSEREKYEASLDAFQSMMAEANRVWENVILHRNNIANIDSAISVLRESNRESYIPSQDLIAEFVDSVIIWECSWPEGAKPVDVAKIVEYKFVDFNGSLSFISERVARLYSLKKLKQNRDGSFSSVNPGKLQKPMSIAVKVNGIRHGYIRLHPMVEPNDTSLRAVCEKQTWYKKHKYHTLQMESHYDKSSNVFSMNRKVQKL